MPEGLVTGPQGVVQVIGLYPEQALVVQAPVGPATKVRRARRLDEHDAAFAAQLGQGGAQQGDFADAGAFEGDFDKGADGPALARKFGVEPAETGGQRRALGLGQLGALPEAGMDMLWVAQNGRGRLHGNVAKYCIYEQYISVGSTFSNRPTGLSQKGRLG